MKYREQHTGDFLELNVKRVRIVRETVLQQVPFKQENSSVSSRTERETIY